MLKNTKFQNSNKKFIYKTDLYICIIHSCMRLIQSGFSHVFGVYSEPIEIVWRLHLYFYISLYPIRDKFLNRRYTQNGNIYFY